MKKTKKLKLKHQKKNEGGITLIALVVTIIVLLILAGIVIMMLTGQNGILNKATEAKELTGTAQEDEQVKLLAMEVSTKTFNFHDNLTQEILDEAISNQFGKDGGEGEIVSDGYNVTVKSSGNIYQIKDDGITKVSEEDELKVDEHPGELEKIDEHTWQINSIEDLVAFSYEVDSGANSYEGDTVELGRSLWFSGENNSYRNENAKYKQTSSGYVPDENGYTTIKNLVTSGDGFIGIGNEKNAFKGSFDGKNHSLYNIYSTNSYSGGTAFITHITSTTNIEIKDFKLIGGSLLRCSNNVGMIGKIDGESNVDIKYCSIELEQITNGTYQGGIVGKVENVAQLNVKNCKSNNNSMGSATKCGGIIGVVQNVNEVNITNSSNYSNISSSGYAGGIIGECEANLKIEKCENHGAIDNAGPAGGIVYLAQGDIAQILNCKNNSDITASGSSGIIETTSGKQLKIENCENNGDISSRSATRRYMCRNKQRKH